LNILLLRVVVEVATLTNLAIPQTGSFTTAVVVVLVDIEPQQALPLPKARLTPLRLAVAAAEAVQAQTPYSAQLLALAVQPTR
jgi:hypothetical protein